MAGRHKTLLALLAKMPASAKVMGVGDIPDRGPTTKDLIEWLMANGNSVLGNHDHMMVCALRGHKFYGDFVWEGNGGWNTLESYSGETQLRFKYDPENYDTLLDTEAALPPSYVKEHILPKLYATVPEAHIAWLEKRPLYIKEPWNRNAAGQSLFISHAPKDCQRDLVASADLGLGFTGHFDRRSEFSLLWNRGVPRPFKELLVDIETSGQEPTSEEVEYFQVFGHNSSNIARWYSPLARQGNEPRYKPEQKPYAVDIDTSNAKVLTGLHWPSMEIYQQEYID
jgi:hypothetical protein